MKVKGNIFLWLCFSLFFAHAHTGIDRKRRKLLEFPDFKEEKHPAYYHNSANSSEHIKFLGKSFTRTKWEYLKDKVNCWTNNGSWVYNNITIIDNWPLYNPCIAYFPYGPKNPCAWLLDRDVLKYTWNVSSSCVHHPLTPFNTDTFCEIMKDSGNLMIVGDSVNELVASQFIVDMSLSSNVNCLMNVRKKDLAVRYDIPCKNKNQELTITMIRNDLLSLVVNESITAHAVEKVWINALTQHNIGLLVLNRGAHYEEDETLLAELNTTLSYLREHHPNISIIWRNTPHGINFKESFFTPPLTSPPPIPRRYNWEKFPHQNELVYR